MDDKQKTLKTAASKVKDIYNAYRRSEDKIDSGVTDETVKATTSKDINEVHVHKDLPEGDASNSSPMVDDTKGIAETTSELEVAKSAVTQAEKERDDLRDQFLRKIAEFENYRKRTDREKEQLALYATERLFNRLVEVLDDLHAALEAGRKSEDYTSMLSGLELIYNKAHRIYEEHGVRPLLAEEGSQFNVDVHEALMHIPHPEIPEGQIIQQIQRGYTLHDKVLRHAKVVTSAGDLGHEDVT